METIDENQSKFENEKCKDEIAIIMRQTTYTKEEAEILFDNLGSVEKCIEHYLGIKPRGEPAISTNQKIFKSIRDFF
uniref:Uncharacterized protein n=1 Tax=viral metagenome TaxID=1070528 RepID=A0A6C0D434_9ZZZZ